MKQLEFLLKKSFVFSGICLPFIFFERRKKTFNEDEKRVEEKVKERIRAERSSSFMSGQRTAVREHNKNISDVKNSMPWWLRYFAGKYLDKLVKDENLN